MNTDLVHQLNITDFNGQVMKGAVNLKGLVNWKDHVTWDIKGRLDHVNPKDKAIPQVVQDFLPPSLDKPFLQLALWKRYGSICQCRL